MNYHDNQHYKCKRQMCHMPVFKQILHGHEPVNPSVE